MSYNSLDKRVLLAWSSGKDAAWTLHILRGMPDTEVVGLLTTLEAATNRVAMHAARRELLEAQAQAVGLPLLPVPIPWPCSNAEYEAAMRSALQSARNTLGITHIAFGDLYLADIRAYREAQLADTGLTPLFPLWQIPTDQLARQMIAGGVKAYLACVDPRRLSADFAGRAFDLALLAELPPDVDPCGEEGEFHTFVWDGPQFTRRVAVTVGETTKRDGFVFADLLPRCESETKR